VRQGVRLVAATAAVVLGCSDRGAPPSTTSALGGDVARVGNVSIPGSLVAEVAHVKGASPREALELLIEDALAAQGGLAEGMDRTPAVAWASAAALASGVARRILDDARALGPATDDELATVTVVHAVVQPSSTLSEQRALAMAGAIERAVAGAKSAADFEASAKAVPHPDALVTVERLEKFGADGCCMPDGSELDPTFVAEAFALPPSATSPLIETGFGWHVIRMVDRAPPAADSDGTSPALPGRGRTSIEQRRRDLEQTVVQMRSRAKLGALLRASRQRVSVDIAPGVDALTTGVNTRPM
jgi:hypothetical protein